MTEQYWALIGKVAVAWVLLDLLFLAIMIIPRWKK